MSKYANLPDIDTAPDIYETAESSNPPGFEATNEGDDILDTPSRNRVKRDENARPTPEELDLSSIATEKATRKFKRAERRDRSTYIYPPSPTSPTSKAKALPLPHRLNELRAQVATLEAELSDPSNPELQAEDINAGELMRSLIDVRNRLEKVGSRKEGRGRLVDIVVSEPRSPPPHPPQVTSPLSKSSQSRENPQLEQIDRRVRELENMLGSSAASLDDASPIPPPLLPTVHKLNTQLTVLAQPRHLDAISRRLKLLLTDLDRLSNTHAKEGKVRQGQDARDTPESTPAQTLELQEQVLGNLNRLAPHLPQIPLILARLRTLSALHSSATSFDASMTTLERDQTQLGRDLEDLTRAVEGLENSIQANETLVKQNVSGLEKRVDDIVKRLGTLEVTDRE